jgi:hypothetical protein
MFSDKIAHWQTWQETTKFRPGVSMSVSVGIYNSRLVSIHDINRRLAGRDCLGYLPGCVCCENIQQDLIPNTERIKKNRTTSATVRSHRSVGCFFISPASKRPLNKTYEVWCVFRKQFCNH